MAQDWFRLGSWAVLGLMMGSFASVLVNRLPNGEQVVLGRSRCPSCRRALSWYELLPLVSWLGLAGHCRTCHARISWLYPALEIVSALLAVFAVATTSTSSDGAGRFVFWYLLLVVAVIDAKRRVIPHSLTLAGVTIGIAAQAFDGGNLWRSMLDVAIPVAVLGAIAMSYRLIRKREGLGGGDVALMGMLGAFLGFGGALGSLVVAAHLGLIHAMIRHRGRLPRKATIAFGVDLAVAAVLVDLWGSAAWEWYASLVG